MCLNLKYTDDKHGCAGMVQMDDNCALGQSQTLTWMVAINLRDLVMTSGSQYRK